MTPLVSVCMTTYNHEKYISQAIESVLAQRTTFGFEVVIGEDCSTDNTLAICRQYEAQHPDIVRVVASEHNIGMHRNYRRTIEACRGVYIAMLDGDDWFTDESKLQIQVDELLNSGADMCYTRSVRRGEDGSSAIYPEGRLHTTLEDMLILNTAENCTTLALKSKILQYYREVEPQSKGWLTDDLPMWLWFAATQRIVAIDCVTAVHRVLATSVSHSHKWNKQLDFCYSLDSIMLWFDECYNNRHLRYFLSRRRQNRALWLLSYHGSVGQFLSTWSHCCKEHPRLVFNIASYGLLAKKLLWRMWR